MNAHEAVLAAVKSLLEQAPSIADEVTRARRRPLAESKTSAINVYFGGSDPSRGAIRGAPIDWSTVVRFECVGRASSGESADQASLRLHALAWERLMSDQSLGGLVMDMAPGPIASDEDDLDLPIGAALGSVLVLHRTAANSLEPLT